MRAFRPEGVGEAAKRALPEWILIGKGGKRREKDSLTGPSSSSSSSFGPRGLKPRADFARRLLTVSHARGWPKQKKNKGFKRREEEARKIAVRSFLLLDLIPPPRGVSPPPGLGKEKEKKKEGDETETLLLDLAAKKLIFARLPLPSHHLLLPLRPLGGHS